MLKRSGTWLFVAPVSALVLTNAVGYEFNVDQVTFIDAKSFRRKRKRFGLRLRVSELESQRHRLFRFLGQAKTLATLRRTGRGEECEQEFLRLASEELAILATSQLGWSRRDLGAAPTLATDQTTRYLSYLLYDTVRGAWYQRNTLIPPYQGLLLDGHWDKFRRNAFFAQLLRIITGKQRVNQAWRRALRTAAVLAGQSQSSRDLPQAFLWNMVALDILLIRQGDKAIEILPERCEALFGASRAWARDKYHVRIENLVVKRHLFVHQGATEGITDDDLEFLDHVLFNVFTNVVKYPKLFPSKEALVEFSEDVKAAKRLRARKRIRPKTMGIW